MKVIQGDDKHSDWPQHAGYYWFMRPDDFTPEIVDISFRDGRILCRRFGVAGETELPAEITDLRGPILLGGGSP